MDFNRKNFYDLKNIDIYLASDSGLIVNNDRISLPVNSIKKIQQTVPEGLAESNQNVRGVIIALEDDIRLRRALSAAANIDFYKYQVSFKLLRS